jgi:hypothetical protein
MNNNNHIRSLTEKFMKGDTSLTEEQELYRYFSGNDIAEDLRPLCPLFTGLAALPSIYNEEEPATIQSRGKQTRIVRLALRWTSVAAVALLLFLGGTAVYRSQNYSEMIVYGQKTNDPALLHHEMASTMKQLDMQPQNSVKEQLDDVLLGQD